MCGGDFEHGYEILRAKGESRTNANKESKTMSFQNKKENTIRARSGGKKETS